MITNSTFKSLITGAAFGAVIASVYFISVPSATNTVVNSVSDNNDVAEDKPLYWVAPMDPNYRRDKPGKSPMGMDLVAVYSEGSSSSKMSAGTIKISPEVINNLGVRTSIVEYKAVSNTIKTVGYITYNEDNMVQVSPRIKGWVEKLHVKSVGEYVTKGQPLYDLYSPDLVNAQEEYLLALERNNKRLIKGAQNRLIALQVPPREISNLKNTRKLKQNISFYAPQNGVVESLSIREGDFVEPNKGILTIADLSDVWVNVAVFERQSAQVSLGDKVTMALDYLPGKQWQGLVDFIYPVLDAKTRTLTVRLKFNNTNSNVQLKPNMFADINIEPINNSKSLVIPIEALIRTGNQDRVVLALGEGRYKSIAVSVGKIFDSSVEILSGLEVNEMVVSSAQFLLDSESSKSSDFKRMHHAQMNMQETMTDDRQEVPTATTTGVINTMMLEHRMLNISRDAIEKWGREAATLDFIVADNLDMDILQENMSINFTFEIIDGDFIITDISPVLASAIEGSSSNDHSNH